MSRLYKCGRCGWTGVRAGNGFAHWCARCARNDKLEFVEDTDITRRTVNGNLHLANMEVREYDDIKVVLEHLPEAKAVRIIIYQGDNPEPIAQEAYGNVSSNLDEHTEGGIPA